MARHEQTYSPKDTMNTPQKGMTPISLPEWQAPIVVAALVAAAVEHQHAAERYAHTSIDASRALARLAHACLESATIVACHCDCSAEHARTIDIYRQRNNTLRVSLTLFGKPQGA